MSELPPDAKRLRTILEWLDEQTAGNDTVLTYLRLQRDAVRQALGETERPPAAPPPAPRPARPAPRPSGPNKSERQSSRFVVDHQPQAVGPEPARIHLDDCTSVVDPQPISDQDARAALLDPSVEPCPFCQPHTELGMD
jgi:hypothetical protein